MAKKKSYLDYPKGYKISFSYKKLTVWYFDKERRVLLLTDELTPYKKYSRKERYEIIAERLKKLGIPVPEYKRTKAEERRSRKNG